MVPVTMTSGTISTRSMCINCHSKCIVIRSVMCSTAGRFLEQRFGTAGVPFSVLSTPYSANGNGIVQGSGPQFASVVPGVPLYKHHPIPGVTQAGTLQWLNPDAFRVGGRSQYRAVLLAATARRIANSETSAATHCAVLIFCGATST